MVEICSLLLSDKKTNCKDLSNKVLHNIFGHENDVISGQFSILHNEKLCDL
jgi:hypothetical protein